MSLQNWTEIIMAVFFLMHAWNYKLHGRGPGSYMTASELTQSVVNAVNDVGVFETGGASKGHRNRNLLFLYPLSESPKTVGEWNHEPLQTFFKQLKNFDKIFNCGSCFLMFSSLTLEFLDF